MDHMFNNCSSLSFLDLTPFNTSECKNLIGIIDDIPELTVLMKNNSDVKNLIYEINNICSNIIFDN